MQRITVNSSILVTAMTWSVLSLVALLNISFGNSYEVDDSFGPVAPSTVGFVLAVTISAFMLFSGALWSRLIVGAATLFVTIVLFLFAWQIPLLRPDELRLAFGAFLLVCHVVAVAGASRHAWLKASEGEARV